MDFLKKIAPVLATALAGPAGGIAVEVIGKVFGWEEATQEKVEALLSSGQLSSEDLAKIKLAELEIKAKEKELGFKFEELSVKDQQAQHTETQVTIRSGDNAEDEYVRHTRPLMARQSWYTMGLYIIGMEVWKAINSAVGGADWELAMVIGAPGLAYMGFRSIFDKFNLAGRVGGLINRK